MGSFNTLSIAHELLVLELISVFIVLELILVFMKQVYLGSMRAARHILFVIQISNYFMDHGCSMLSDEYIPVDIYLQGFDFSPDLTALHSIMYCNTRNCKIISMCALQFGFIFIHRLLFTWQAMSLNAVSKYVVKMFHSIVVDIATLKPLM